ncbi:MAG: SGNH hydrolase domain-containing protein, partial [Pseudomonadota bacterium]
AVWERKPMFSELVDLTASGCPFLLGLSAYYGEGEISKRCTAEYQAQRLAFLEEYADETSTTVILSARLPLYLYGDDFDNSVGGSGVRTRRLFMSRNGDFYASDHEANFLKSLEDSIMSIVRLADRVILVLPTHVNGWDPNVRATLLAPRVFRLEQLEEALEIPLGPVLQRTMKIDTLLNTLSDKIPAVSVINPRDLTCSQEKGTCNSMANGVFLFQGSDHLSSAANRWIAGRIEEHIVGPQE